MENDLYMALDIFAPQISAVPAGLEGKVILIYGHNSLGKTRQAAKASKALFLQVEQAGLNALDSVNYMPINKWTDVKSVSRQLAKDPEKTRAAYDTIVIDEIEGFGKLCEQHVATSHGVTRIKDGNDGFGLWKEYDYEVWSTVKQLLSVGLTVIFLGHDAERKVPFGEEEYTQKYPKGDKRVVAPIVDQSNIIAYVYPRVDENGMPIHSGAQLLETPYAFARSHFEGVPFNIEPFSYKGLEDTIIDAIEKNSGGKTITYAEQKAKADEVEVVFEEIQTTLFETCTALVDAGLLDKIQPTFDKHFGKGTTFEGLVELQKDAMVLVNQELRDFLAK